MPDLSFSIDVVRPMEYTATPAIAAQLRIRNTPSSESIQSISLNCQLQIQPLGRSYSAMEESRLLDLFGERERWGQTMRPLHWINLVLKVPPFTAETIVDLPLPCSFDFEVAANKFFYGLEQGSVAVNAMFSGTVFFFNENHTLQIAQISWDREARFRVPVEVWKAALDAHFPKSAWMRLPRDVFDRLYRYKVARGIVSWESVANDLLDQAEAAEAAMANCGGGVR